MISFLENLWTVILHLLNDYGYFSLFITSFLSSTLIPMASEAFVIAMIEVSRKKFWEIIIIATAGNFLGSCTTYYIGHKGVNHFLYKYFSPSEKKMEKAKYYFEEYGAYALLFSWVPVIGDVLVFAAGVLKYKFLYFFILTFIGKFARYIFIACTAGLILNY
ncbi:MAG: DedA family protein [Methanosarcinaceae archaeon]|nr:DedA family protein [Methanosarcinaceae archaeon]